MLMAVEGPYALMVQPDDILISPREVDEHFGTMICFHPRYALGDSHNYADHDDFLRDLYVKTVAANRAKKSMSSFWSKFQIRKKLLMVPVLMHKPSIRRLCRRFRKSILFYPYIFWITAGLPCRPQVFMIPGTAGRWVGYMSRKRTH